MNRSKLKSKEIALVVGARPNFMKAAPLFEAMRGREDYTPAIFHTGQHFSKNMSDVFFRQLSLPQPNASLDIHQGSVVEQIGKTILGLETVLTKETYDLVVVFGDVNATLAASITANKLGLRLAHVEAGLRSFDRSMPEEHNRVVTDRLADILFTPSTDADDNLIHEGVDNKRIHRVGNIMADSLLQHKDKAEKVKKWNDIGVRPGEYGLVTLHRPANVDTQENLKPILSALIEIQRQAQLVFPIHPRTYNNLEEYGFLESVQNSGIKITKPLGYLDFLSLLLGSQFVITDSGGIQEETTILGIPCLTVRKNTERPITIEQGTNQLVGTSYEGILTGFAEMTKDRPVARIPELWDGKTATRIIAVLDEIL